VAQTGRKIYYDLATGNKLVDTGECEGALIEATQEQDFASNLVLSQRVPSTVGCLQFAFGEQADNFAKYLFHVDVTQTPHVIAWDAAVGQTLAQTQDAKKAQLQTMYAQTLAAGFVSSASGTSTNYGFAQTNQDDMTQVQGAISAGIEAFPVAYGDNLGNIVMLTQAQFTALESDANKFKWAQVKQLRTFIGQVMAATTVDAVNAVQWTAATY
jgi:hypothetical protein